MAGLLLGLFMRFLMGFQWDMMEYNGVLWDLMVNNGLINGLYTIGF
jgi:hypothetical protein